MNKFPPERRVPRAPGPLCINGDFLEKDMKKRIIGFIGTKLMDFVLWIYEQRPEGESLTIDDITNIQKARKLRKKFQ